MPPIGSVGFNYLADDVVCREIRGREESGRLVLSSDVKCGGSRGASARIECRSCWQTFPIPEGTQWVVASEPPRVANPAEAPQTTPPQVAAVQPAPVFEKASDRIAQNLAILLSETVEEAGRPAAERLAILETGLADLVKGQGEVQQLRQDVEALRQQDGAFSEGQQSLRSRLATVETAIAAQAENQPQLWEQVNAIAAGQNEFGTRFQTLEGQVEGANSSSVRIAEVCIQLQDVQQALQKRLDAQAEAIRLLHATAQDRIARREELQAAVQRLEEIAGALEQPKPLPEEL
jgi:hypothetical protein